LRLNNFIVGLAEKWAGRPRDEENGTRIEQEFSQLGSGWGVDVQCGVWSILEGGGDLGALRSALEGEEVKNLLRKTNHGVVVVEGNLRMTLGAVL